MNKINGFWFFTLSILGLSLLVSIVRLPPVDDFFALNKDNELADALNGLTAPFIGLISAYLLYRALMAQNETNRLQAQALEMQRKEFELTVAAQNETNRLQTQALEMQRKEFELAVAAQNETNRLQTQSLEMQQREFEATTIAQAIGRIDLMIDNFQYFQVDKEGSVIYSNKGILAIRDVMYNASKYGKIRRMTNQYFESMAFIFNRILNIDSFISNSKISPELRKDFEQHIESYGKALANHAGGIEFIYDSEKGDLNDPIYLDFQRFWKRFRNYVYG